MDRNNCSASSGAGNRRRGHLPARAALSLDIHLEAVFRWRHRFLAEPNGVKSKAPAGTEALAGAVEAGETSCLHSRKGQRKLDRPARARDNQGETAYHIQNVNNSCGRLKGWMLRFRGVATKYFDSCLGWHRADEREGRTQSASRMLAAAWG